jgi:hypothetical membrane protein
MRYNTIAVTFIVFVILAAHIAAVAPYSWRDNTISELASQGYEQAWIMRAGFIGFGALVIIGAMQRTRSRRPLWYREIPLVLYGLAILLSGIFSTKPFMPDVGYSGLESHLHSIMATHAGVGISLGILLYMLSDNSARGKIVHMVTLVLIVVLSALFGMSTAGAGVVQRFLYAVGFAWLIYIETWKVAGKVSS